jgi:hypothetical protein
LFNRLGDSAPVLSRAVDVASPTDIQTPADTINAIVTVSSQAIRTERLKTGANQSYMVFTSLARRVFRPSRGKELAQRKPDHLHEKLEESSEAKRQVHIVPNLISITNWISEAKKLPRVVSY